MSQRFLDVRRLYRPLPMRNADPVPPPAGPSVRDLHSRVEAFAESDSASQSSPATNVLTFVRPELTESLGFMARSREAMNLLNSTTNPTRPASLEAAYLLLVERAGTASFNKGPEACAAFVASVLGELTADDAGLDQLRRAIPEVARAEREASELVSSRCAVCPVRACTRSPR